MNEPSQQKYPTTKVEYNECGLFVGLEQPVTIESESCGMRAAKEGRVKANEGDTKTKASE